MNNSLMNCGIAFLVLAGLFCCFSAFMLMASCSDDVRGIAPGSLAVVTLAFICAIIGTVTGAVGVQQAYFYNPGILGNQSLNPFSAAWGQCGWLRRAAPHPPPRAALPLTRPAPPPPRPPTDYQPGFGLAVTSCVFTFIAVISVGIIAFSPVQKPAAPAPAPAADGTFSGVNPNARQVQV